MNGTVLRIIANAVRPRPNHQVWEYLRDQIRYKVKGQIYSVENVPYLRQPFEDLRDNTIRSITMPCPVQSGKTVYIQGGILYFLDVEKANQIYYGQDVDAVGEFSDTRMMPDIEAYLKHLRHPDRNKTKKNLIVTNVGNWLAMMSGDNPKNRRSRSARVVWIDEGAILKSGALPECEKRTSAYQLTNALVVKVSTPEISFELGPGGELKPTDFYSEWEQSTKHIWHTKCPDCGASDILSLKSYKWDTNEETKPGGEETSDGYKGGTWFAPKFKETVRWICDACDSPQKPNTTGYRQMQLSGHYQQTNQIADPTRKGYHYPGFAVKWVDHAGLCLRFVQARDVAKKGLREPLRKVITNDMGEFWKDGDHGIEEITLQAPAGYHLGDADWAEEYVAANGIRYRNLTVDVQKESFYCGVRMWSKEGASRLLWTEQVGHWEDVFKIQERFDVWKGIQRSTRHWVPGRVYVDAGWVRHQKFKGDSEVQRMCAKYNWWALKGSDVRKFTVRLRKGKTIERYWSAVQNVMVAKGTYCKTFTFANPVLCSNLALLISGQAERWEVPGDAPEWYYQQLKGKRKEPTPDGTGERWVTIGPDHAYDMEKMQLPQCYSDGLFGPDLGGAHEDED